MAFGKAKEDIEPGRYLVEHITTPISGKMMLQAELNRGEREGWKLVQIAPGGDGKWILVVWDTKK